jgi:hypothetical protein
LLIKGDATQETGSTTTIYDNAVLATQNGFTMSGGVLSTLGTNSLITGKLTVSSGNIYPGGNLTTGALNIDGDFEMDGGTLNIDLNYGTSTRDVVNVNYGNTTVTIANSGTTLTVNTLNGTPANGAFIIIMNYDSLTGDFATTHLQYTGGNYRTHPGSGTNSSYQLEAEASSSPRRSGAGSLPPSETPPGTGGGSGWDHLGKSAASPDWLGLDSALVPNGIWEAPQGLDALAEFTGHNLGPSDQQLGDQLAVYDVFDDLQTL